MHPRYLRDIVDISDTRDQVFVAMSFDKRFDHRFHNVIAPAISDLERDGKPFAPHRVDRSVISDSVIAEIVDGIVNDVLIFVDITTLELLDGKPVRNSNVMYELGLAHALRQPEHVMIFRSDDDPILFDVSGIRVHSYDPDGEPDAAREKVAQTLASAADMAHRFRDWAVEYALGALDPLSATVLMSLAGYPVLETAYPDRKQMLRAVAVQPTLHRLFELGLARTRVIRVIPGDDDPLPTTDDMTQVEITRLGHQVIMKWLENSGVAERFAAVSPVCSGVSGNRGQLSEVRQAERLPSAVTRHNKSVKLTGKTPQAIVARYWNRRLGLIAPVMACSLHPIR
jgi:hypothetical protein